MNELLCLCSVFCCVYKFCPAGCRYLHLYSLVYIAICMSCYCNRLLPVLNKWLNALNYDRRTEYCTIKDSSYCSVRALIHCLKIVLSHSCCIRSNSCTLYSNTILLCCLCRINCYLIICLITVLKTKIIIFCIQFNKRT